MSIWSGFTTKDAMMLGGASIVGVGSATLAATEADQQSGWLTGAEVLTAGGAAALAAKIGYDKYKTSKNARSAAEPERTYSREQLRTEMRDSQPPHDDRADRSEHPGQKPFVEPKVENGEAPILAGREETTATARHTASSGKDRPDISTAGELARANVPALPPQAPIVSQPVVYEQVV